MVVSLSCRALACALGLVVSFGSILSVSAKESSSASAEPAVVDLFEGMESGKVEAIVIPRDSKKITLQLKNKSDQPLTIRLPEAFAAVPVQAQVAGGGLFGGGGFGGGGGGIGFGQGAGNQAGGQGGTQGLGASGGQNAGNGNGAGRRNRGGGPVGGVFNVPAGKVIKVKLTSVCLEFGKPEPHAHNEYVVKPIETLCDKVEVVSILRSLGDGEVSQEVAQLAAWNVANGTSFEQIAALKSKLGLQTPIYSQNSIAAAAELVSAVSAAAKADASEATASASASASSGR
ncbi:MAG: hypothetical protein K8R36_05765 [Planctomycetales bacterium]|nr:hypothetical protein [Planctomycetales bacterium]